MVLDRTVHRNRRRYDGTIERPGRVTDAGALTKYGTMPKTALIPPTITRRAAFIHQTDRRSRRLAPGRGKRYRTRNSTSGAIANSTSGLRASR